MADKLFRDRLLRDVLIDHAARYPFWELDDVYKLIHHAAMGSEHAVTDERAAREGLARELRQMGTGPDEPLIDPIAPDGAIVRVHLRPFAQRGLDPELLLEAFMRTGREFRGSPQQIVRGLAEAAQLVREGALPFSLAHIQQLLARMQAAGFPAVHHTAAFVSHYRPAYRVVARAALPVDASGCWR